ncbi:MAG: ABC transporter permease, partial [Gemmatimonadetes bacterium]|nr:ABC transporter permease [Gemmatimonadota bacterium]
NRGGGGGPAGADLGIDQIVDQAAYHGPYAGAGDVDVWIPLQASEASYPRDTHPFLVVGRLAPGVGVEAAQVELARIAADLERTYRSNDGRGVHVEALVRVVFGPVRPALLVLWGAVALVLLVACVNVANLLLARGAARAREVAVRAAVGAGLERLGRQFVVESVVLALLGGAAGGALAWALLRGLLVVAPADVPRLGDVALDARVLAVTLGVSLAVGVAFGLVPLAQARWVDVARILASAGGRGATGGRARRRVRQALVVAELALSVALVVGAGLLIRSFWTVLRADPGFRTEGVLKAQFELPRSRYPQDYRLFPHWKEIQAFDAAVLERARALPGVRSAALAGAHPLDAGFTNSWSVVGREGESADWPEISVRQVTPGYFPTLGIRLLRGRLLQESDDAAAPRVGLINETAARRFFAGRDPLGEVIRIWGDVRWRIVGVIADERIHGVTEAAPPALYLPLAQAPGGSGVLLVRTAGDPARLAEPVRGAIHAVDPGLAVYGVEPLEATFLASIAQRRFTMLVLGAFAAVALLLALVGVHGVLSYTVSQRQAEMGIRMALGASRRDVVALVLRGGLGLALLGTALGLVGALAGSRVLASLLYGVGPLDPVTFLGVPAAVLAAAALASWLPARRATRVDPIVALRAE